MPTLQDLIELSKALLTPTIAAIAVYIAYQQHVTARQRLRLDLYERRLSVYKQLMILLTAILREADVSRDDLSEFVAGTSEAAFLFDDDVGNYLEEIYKKAVTIMKTRTLMESQKIATEEHVALSDKHDEALNWLLEQVELSTAVFAPFMKFAK